MLLANSLTPAKAGIQQFLHWVPASAGTSERV